MKCPSCKHPMVLQEEERGSSKLVWWCMWCGLTKKKQDEPTEWRDSQGRTAIGVSLDG